MRYPEFLKEQGIIGYIAPSYGAAFDPYRTAFLNAVKKFEQMGYGTDLGPNCFESSGIGISNTPELCGKELTEYYVSEKNEILLTCGGGELMCEVIPYMDFSRIKSAKPKWYMGFSDNTNFTFLSATICDTAAIYGPCAPAFGMEPWHESLTDAWKLITGGLDTVSGYDKWEKESLKDEEHPLEPYHVTEDTVIRRFPDEDIKITGRLLGGCMDCLGVLVGTGYDKVAEFNERYMEDGIIWFLEACDLNVMSMRRTIWQMKHAGWFKYVKGFLIGRPYQYGEDFLGLDQYHAVADLLEEYNVPIIMDLDIGHLAPMMPIVCGSTAEVDVAENNIQISYTWK